MKRIEWFLNRLYFAYYESVLCVVVAFYWLAAAIKRIVWRCCDGDASNEAVDKKKKRGRSKPVIDRRMEGYYVWRFVDIPIFLLSLLMFWNIVYGVAMLLSLSWICHIGKWPFVTISFVVTFILCYVCLWRNDKYMRYFKSFQKSSRWINICWVIVAYLCIVLAVVVSLFLMRMLIAMEEASS